MSVATYWFNKWMDEQDYQWSLPECKRNWRKVDVYFNRYILMVK